MTEILKVGANYHISNLIFLLIFSFFYTWIDLRAFRLKTLFVTEILKNFLAGVLIYAFYIVAVTFV